MPFDANLLTVSPTLILLLAAVWVARSLPAWVSVGMAAVWDVLTVAEVSAASAAAWAAALAAFFCSLELLIAVAPLTREPNNAVPNANSVPITF